MSAPIALCHRNQRRRLLRCSLAAKAAHAAAAHVAAVAVAVAVAVAAEERRRAPASRRRATPERPRRKEGKKLARASCVERKERACAAVAAAAATSVVAACAGTSKKKKRHPRRTVAGALCAAKGIRHAVVARDCVRASVAVRSAHEPEIESAAAAANHRKNRPRAGSDDRAPSAPRATTSAAASGQGCSTGDGQHAYGRLHRSRDWARVDAEWDWGSYDSGCTRADARARMVGVATAQQALQRHAGWATAKEHAPTQRQ